MMPLGSGPEEGVGSTATIADYHGNSSMQFLASAKHEGGTIYMSLGGHQEGVHVHDLLPSTFLSFCSFCRTFTLMRASYWVAVILAIVAVCAVKALYGADGSNGGPQQQPGATGYSPLPQTQQEAVRAGTNRMQKQATGLPADQLLQQRPSAERCLLTVESG